MGAGPTISPQKILEAARDNTALREVLTQVQRTVIQQQEVTNTTPQAGTTTSKRNPAAAVPSQATGSVSLLQKTYIVQLVNAGGVSPISQLQRQQQTGNINPFEPVRSIFHQIRASTSPAFNLNSNTQTFGGETGSAQTYWTLNGLGTGTWYIQFRSSYDGVNWNQWKNANGGSALNRLVDQVTVEDSGEATWALCTLPGGMVFGIGAANVVDQEAVTLAEQLYSSGMMALVGPNGFTHMPNAISGWLKMELDLELPELGTPAAAGLVPDYPVVARTQTAVAESLATAVCEGSFFALCCDPSNSNVKLYPQGAAMWAVLRLPGGARIAIGQGKAQDGNNITMPPLPGFSSARMFTIAALTECGQNESPITGVFESKIAGVTAAGAYLNPDGTARRGQTVRWIAIAWEEGAPTITAGGKTFLVIPLQGGHNIILSASEAAAGGSITLPDGYTADKGLTICTPGGTENTGHHLRGVQTCAMFGLKPILTYSDNVNYWTGATNWMGAWWK